MPMFEHPWALALLPLAVVVAAWGLRVRRPAQPHALLAAFRTLPRGRARRVRWTQAVLAGLATMAFVVALANPRRPDLKTPVPAEGVSIVLALDVSGSMATVDFVPQAGATPVSRLDAARHALTLFVAGGESADGLKFKGRPDDRVGLISFASVPETVCPLTYNHTVLLAVLRDLRTAGATNAETNIGDAIGEGCLRLDAAGPGRRKVLVLLSDGEHNKVGPDVLNPRTAAAIAEKLAIPVYTIDCGGDPTGPDPVAVQQRADGRATLEAVAAMTGGRAFVANDGTQLREAFRAIDALEKQPQPTNLYRRYHDDGGWYAGCGLALLGLSAWLGASRWRRQP